MNFKRLAVIAATVSLAVAGGSFAGVALATPSPSGQQYTGCLLHGSLFNVAVGASPIHGCPRFATQIEWNQTGPQGPPGASNTKLFTWTVTVSGTVSGPLGAEYAKASATTNIPAGVLLTPISTSASGDISSCDDPAFSDDIVVQPGALAVWSGTTFSSTPASQTRIALVQQSGPLSAEVYCTGAATVSPVTITITFTETIAPSGPAQTYT